MTIAHNYKNNAQAPLKTAIGASSTSLILSDGYGSLFPSGSFPLMLEKYDTSLRVIKREIVYCTSRVGDVLTITRSYDSCPQSYDATTQTSVSMSFDAGDIATLTLVSKHLDEIKTEVNAKLNTSGGLRTGFGSSKTIIVSPTGSEEIKNSTTASSLSSTDQIVARTSGGDEVKVAYSAVKNDLGQAGKWVQTTTMGEALSAGGATTITASPLSTLAGNISYTGSGSAIFDTDTGTSAVHNPPNSTASVTGGISGFSGFLSLTSCSFSYSGTNSYAPFTPTVTYTITGLNQSGGTETLATGTLAKATNTVANVAISNSTKVNSVSITLSVSYGGYNEAPLAMLNNFVATGTYTTESNYALAVVNSITYTSTLASNATGSVLLDGIRFSVPYATTLTTVKTQDNASSGSAVVSLRDDSNNVLASATMTSGTNTVTFSYALAANTVYRLVTNDSVNWASNRKYTPIATMQATFPYLVSGTSNNVTDNTNALMISVVTLDFGGKAYKARANRTTEPQFASFAGFATGPLSVGESVALNSNEGSSISGFFGLTQKRTYYVSNVAGVISTSLGNIKFPVGEGKSSSEVVITKRLSDSIKTLGNVSSFYHFGGNLYINFLFVQGTAQSVTLSGRMSITINSMAFNQITTSGGYVATVELPEGQYTVTYSGNLSSSITLMH